ncbi:MAG: AMP nucleosidase [Gammaproteobacteria bacterium]|nr:AMP nucleosidase [Gammaproteobacteria bacterium]|tara:strand:- start:3588 stop:3809 length:222 start_codon:yes stop_codon:yes gene_type:complete
METDGPECITIIAEDFSPAAMEYHRQRMAEKGYTIDTPIVRHRFYETDGLGEPKSMFDGQVRYSATFVKKKVE